MSFIKLNQQRINYQQRETQPDDSYILSDIVDSTVSPEYPKIIRTTDELAIYFGTGWDQYDYYIQLLSSGVSLLLYKPLLGNQSSQQQLPVEESEGFPDNPSEGVLYSIGDDKYYIYNKDTDTFIDQSDLPENSGDPKNSPSWKNRDTLGISRQGTSYTPSFIKEDSEEEELTFSYIQKDDIKTSIQNYGDLDTGVSFSLLLDFSEVDPKSWKDLSEDVYIVFTKAITKVNNRFDIFWVSNHWDEDPLQKEIIPKELVDNEIVAHYFQNYSKSETLKDISSLLRGMGYSSEVDGDTIIINSPQLFRLSGCFNNIPNLRVTSRDEVSDQITHWGLQEENNEISYYKISQEGEKIYYKELPNDYLEFYSKLLGVSLDPISVTIKKATSEEDSYQITISKLNYSEVFYGSIASLAVDINKNSRLTYCSLSECYSSKDDSLVTSSLPEGTWQLSGGEIEVITPRSRWNSLKTLEDINIQEDFLLVPDIQKWRIYGVGDLEYYREYNQLLDYATTKNCQVLVQNNPIAYIETLPENGVTYYLGDKILNGSKELSGKIESLSSESISYKDLNLTNQQSLEIPVDQRILKEVKQSGLIFSGKDYSISQVKINDEVINDSSGDVFEGNDFSLSNDKFSSLKVGDKITIEVSSASEESTGTILTSSDDPLKSNNITGFQVGESLFNSEGGKLPEKISEGETSYSGEVVKINNTFYKVSEDNVVSEVSQLTLGDTLTEASSSPDELIQLRSGYLVNSLGDVVSENTKKVDQPSDYYKIKDTIINSSGEVLSEKFKILPVKTTSKPSIYSLGGKYYNASTQEEVTNEEFALPWGNDFYFNYTGDYENRLIYFYKDFLIDGLYRRPGYYYFLQGILFNNWEIDKVIYDHDEGPEDTELGKQLELKKSNYISLYNNSYHYKKFFWGPTGYYCSGTLKYCQSRISRLFEKYKWKLLGFKREGELRSYIQNILNSLLEKNSSLVHSLTLSDLQLDNNKAEIRLLLRTKEFIEKDIKLNITLNYIY